MRRPTRTSSRAARAEGIHASSRGGTTRHDDHDRTRPTAWPASSAATACLPMGGRGRRTVTRDAARRLCRQASAMNWCNCVPGRDDDTGVTGAWDCTPFTNVTAVIAVFDRLLDTAPLDPGDAGGVTDVRHDDGWHGRPGHHPADRLLGDRAAGRAHLQPLRPVLRQLPGRRAQPVLGAAARVSLGRDRHGQPAGRQGPRQGRHDAVHGRRPAGRADTLVFTMAHVLGGAVVAAGHDGDTADAAAAPTRAGVHQRRRPQPSRHRHRQRRRRRRSRRRPATAAPRISVTPMGGRRLAGRRDHRHHGRRTANEPARSADRRGRDRDLHRA